MVTWFPSLGYSLVCELCHNRGLHVSWGLWLPACHGRARARFVGYVTSRVKMCVFYGYDVTQLFGFRGNKNE
jgi:hypothetical protein